MVDDVYTDRRAAEAYATFGNRHCGAEYTVEEVPNVSKAGYASRKAFQAWIMDEGHGFLGTLRETHRRLAEQVLWCAFTAGERHGRTQLDDRILELEAEIAAMSLRLDGLALLGNRLHEVLALELSCYEPTNPRLPMLSKRLRDWESVRDRMEFERQGKPNVIEAELAQLRDAYDAARQDLDVAKRKASSANTRLDCALTRGNRLRNVMSMLTSPDEDTRLLVHAAADEWDEFLRITTDSRASEAPKDTP